MTTTLLEFSRAGKRYGTTELPVWALRDLDLCITLGEFVAVCGPSGSGKSTLCNLAGLVDEPSSGRLHLQGRDVVGLSDKERSLLRNRHIGFVYQHFNLIPVLSALENVLLPLQIRGQMGATDRERGESLLAALGIDDLAARRPDELSGGQQQRVAIARALVADPDLVIADEPTANLDSANAAAIVTLMDELNRSRGTTFLFSTHDERILGRVRRRVYLRDGTVDRDEVYPT